jgi:ankyrin repeat protein
MADPNVPALKQQTALHYAAIECFAVKLLLEHGADPRAADLDGMTPLHFAVDIGCVEGVKHLLQHGADPNALNSQWRTPLHYAAMRCRNGESCAELVELLLSHGADPKIRDMRGKTPLEYILTDEQTRVVKLLLFA